MRRARLFPRARSPRRTQAALAVIAVVLGSMSAGCGGAARGQAQSGLETGQEIFDRVGCVGCHTLAAADARGRVGPNLDETRPSAEAVTRLVRDGGDRMPRFGGRLSDEQIDAVARYVAASARR